MGAETIGDEVAGMGVVKTFLGTGFGGALLALNGSGGLTAGGGVFALIGSGSGSGSGSGLTILFLTRSQGLSVDLPSAQTSEPKQSVQMNITIEPDGKMYLDRKPIKLEQLKGALTEKIAPNSESVVIITADEKVEHGTVVKVMDRLRQVPGAKMAIAAEQE